MIQRIQSQFSDGCGRLPDRRDVGWVKCDAVARFDTTSPGGRVFAVVLMALCLAIGTAAVWFNADTLIEGHTTVRLRRGGRIALSGWLAYAYAINGLVFAAAALCFAPSFAAVGLGPQRWGRAAFALLRVGAILFAVAAIGAMAIVLTLLVRGFA